MENLSNETKRTIGRLLLNNNDDELRLLKSILTAYPKETIQVITDLLDETIVKPLSNEGRLLGGHLIEKNFGRVRKAPYTQKFVNKNHKWLNIEVVKG